MTVKAVTVSSGNREY